MLAFVRKLFRKEVEEVQEIIQEINQEIKFTCIKEGAIIPTKAHIEDAGFDLYSITSATIPVGSRLLIHTGVCVALPIGYCGLIQGRSGLAANNGILTHPGVIDAGYTGSIGVILFNLGSEPFTVLEGSRIAQIVITKFEQPQTETSSNSPSPKRLKQGFGSSGQ